MPLMFEGFLFYAIVFLINLIFIFKRIPLVAFPLGLFSLYVSATVFLTDSTIPVNPYSTMLLFLLTTCMLLTNSLVMTQKENRR